MNAMQKKLINEALSQNNQAEVWHQVALFLGKKPQKREVCNIIEENATGKNSKKAYTIAYNCERKEKIREIIDKAFISRGGYKSKEMQAKQKESAFEMVHRLYKEDLSSYTKVPMISYDGYLYFCSPFYKFKDYNKVCICEVSQNKNFSDKIIDLCDKIWIKRGFKIRKFHYENGKEIVDKEITSIRQLGV